MLDATVAWYWMTTIKWQTNLYLDKRKRMHGVGNIHPNFIHKTVGSELSITTQEKHLLSYNK